MYDNSLYLKINAIVYLLIYKFNFVINYITWNDKSNYVKTINIKYIYGP